MVVFREDGARVVLSPRLRKVLAALAQRPQMVVSVEKLLDEVWPDVDERIARRRLRTAIWKLRTLLASGTATMDRPVIRWQAPGYLLDAAEAQLDWSRFRRLRRAGERALAGGEPVLARSYLSAALGLWRGTEALAGVDVSADDLAFIAEQETGRERAVRALVDARLRLDELDEAIPALEALVVRDPLDDVAVRQLALAHYRSGNPVKALSTSRRYIELAEQEGVLPSPRIAKLETAILRRDPAIEGPALHGVGTGAGRSVAERRVFLAGLWAPFVPSPAGPVPAELHLAVEDHGGSVHEATETSVEGSFPEVRPGLDAAIAIHRALGDPPAARLGVHVRLPKGSVDAFDGPPRARARLLASVAREGQVLVSGAAPRRLKEFLPPGAGLRGLGRHRLNALTPSTTISRLTSPELPDLRATPRWFDRSRVHNLAEDPFRLVGREGEVAAVTSRLEEARLVTLTGAPGSGKTRLAAHVALGLSRGYRGAVWFVDLRSLSQPGLVAPTVGEVLRVPRAGPIRPVDALIRYLGRRRALVVLDNCEHLLTECRDLVDRVLPACPGLTVLGTSREALHSHLEHVIAVAPLEPPPPGPTEAILANPAVRLFLDRLDSVRSLRETPEATEAQAVARICRAVEGIPLALVLAAARARELGIDTLADALDDTLGEGPGLRILSRTTATSEAAPETLDGTMEWSYRLLPEQERRLFESLSVFRGGFSAESAAAVCSEGSRLSPEEALSGLGHLVQASMVTVEEARGGAGRFRLLQPVRDFAARKLGRRRGAAAIRRRHAMHFLTLAEEAEPHVRGPQDPAAVDRLDASVPDLYAAIRWAIGQNDADTALRLVGSLWVFWLVRGRLAEGRQMLESALAADRTLSAERIRALVAYSHLSWAGGDIYRTLETCREALTVAEAIGDRWGWAWAPLGLAAVEMFKSEDDWVPLRIAELLPLFRALGNDWDTGQALQTLGGATWHRGRYEEAEEALSGSVALYRSLGHPTLMASLLAHGLVLALLGHLEAGAAEVDRSMVTAYEAGDLVDLAWALCHRAAIARYAGQHDQARRYYRDALRTARDAGSGWAILWALDGLGSTEAIGLRVPGERLETSVQLLARVDVMARETGISLAPREREYHARDLERAATRLGKPAFEAAVAQGEQLALEEAIELALGLED